MTDHENEPLPDEERPRRGADPAEDSPGTDPSTGKTTAPSAGQAARRGPSRAADDPHQDDRAPSHKVMAVGTIVVLVIALVVGFAAYAINSIQPSTRSASPVASSTWKLELPVQIGDYTRDPNAAASPSTQAGSTVISATYSKGGKDSAVILMSRPQADLKKFMSEAGMTSVTQQELSDRSGTALCGVDADHNDTGCVVLQESTAVLAMGLQDQSRQDLADLAQQIGIQAAGSK
ncbi:hypothetical protein [Acidipropionibacterium jensenii]|uniref:Uncharacterized protein n=1 Tax=Acidipropionibacterium jensenii TaxID=1749 RepID=A0A3Q9UJS5_9ACTN|nr:hypothetical protein [Acidipropionibacterium jensenii]AZZ43101.1 hypothetical protein C0Z11_13225 [Acidipropionibacterium jensenii]MDN5977757.1 hypothetical protein [Acidipropionibacterium jensenii]MDN5997396.1 hypothetical protein [Acidipropionibacterium jensenii]MDN6427219.1 hypothetical protein [Acidipropionibacterium jensenii]MDN6442588.1 hypothetical protein [Acidipropionibacterium jensenii]